MQLLDQKVTSNVDSFSYAKIASLHHLGIGLRRPTRRYLVIPMDQLDPEVLISQIQTTHIRLVTCQVYNAICLEPVH